MQRRVRSLSGADFVAGTGTGGNRRGFGYPRVIEHSTATILLFTRDVLAIPILAGGTMDPALWEGGLQGWVENLPYLALLAIGAFEEQRPQQIYRWAFMMRDRSCN